MFFSKGSTREFRSRINRLNLGERDPPRPSVFHGAAMIVPTDDDGGPFVSAINHCDFRSLASQFGHDLIAGA